MNTVIITGGSGFIGRNLREYFAPKYEILAPTHKELDLLDAEAVRSFLAAHPHSIIIHTAAIGVTRKQQQDQTGIAEANTKMAANLLDASEHYEKIVLFGSGAEYGKQHDLVKVKEEEFGKVEPADDYGRSKFAISRLAEDNPKAIVLRLFAVYGKYEDYATRFISNCLCRTLLGIPVVIKQDVKFDFLFVDDLARIVEYFIENQPKHRLFNVGSGTPRTLTSIFNDVRRVTGKEVPVSIQKPGMNKEYTCDTSRLLAELPSDFRFTDFDASLLELYNWYQERIKDIDPSAIQFDK